MLSCKESTRLVSEGLDRELPFWQRFGLRLHRVMCRGCSRFARQITALNRIIADHYGDGPPRGSFRTPPPGRRAANQIVAPPSAPSYGRSEREVRLPAHRTTNPSEGTHRLIRQPAEK